MAWYKNATNTLLSASDTITVTALTSNTFLLALVDCDATGGAIQNPIRVGNGSIDSGSNYALRYSTNGGADGAWGNTTFMGVDNNQSVKSFGVSYLLNIATQEKLLMKFIIFTNNAGAGYAPNRDEAVGKWANTSVVIDQLQSYNGGAGDYAIGSNVSVLGSKETPVVVNIQNGTVFEETDTNRSYIWNSSTSTWTQF